MSYGTRSLKKFITTYPVLFGGLIGLLIVLAVLIIVIWAPSIGDQFERHARLAQGVYFTAFFFVIWLYTLRNWRRRRMFWTSFCILFLLHVGGVLVFSLRFRPLLVWEWTILGIVESFLVVAFVYWTTTRFGHSHKNDIDTFNGIDG